MVACNSLNPPCCAPEGDKLSRVDTGLLLFVEDPVRTVSRWSQEEPSGDTAVEILAAVHGDLVSTLLGAPGTALYLAPTAAADADYVESLASISGVEILQVPMAPPLQRWDAGLSILFNRCTHRKVLCADGGVPDVTVEDLSRARRKLDLYRMVLGREGEDRCWLVGFNGYEEILGLADAGPEDTLHPLLQAAGRAGLDVSLLDTKRTLATEPDMNVLRGLARRAGYPRLRAVLERHQLARKRSDETGAG